MSISTIDSKAALIVVDLQRGIVALPTAEPSERIVERAARLADAFRARELPVVLVRVTGVAPGRTDREQHDGPVPDDWVDLMPELDAQDSDVHIAKQQWGAFHRTGLDEHLRDLGVTQVVLAGIATSMGVESTARAAHEHGYHVVLATDAMTDLDPVAHERSVEHVFPGLGETGTTDDVLAALDARR